MGKLKVWIWYTLKLASLLIGINLTLHNHNVRERVGWPKLISEKLATRVLCARCEARHHEAVTWAGKTLWLKQEWRLNIISRRGWTITQKYIMKREQNFLINLIRTSDFKFTHIFCFARHKATSHRYLAWSFDSAHDFARWWLWSRLPLTVDCKLMRTTMYGLSVQWLVFFIASLRLRPICFDWEEAMRPT